MTNMQSDSAPLTPKSEAQGLAVAKAIHRLLDIIALLVVKKIEKDKIEKRNAPDD
jgi:hypothetical protein